MKKQELTEQQIQEIIALYKQGISCKKIAPIVGIGWGIINKIINKYNIPRIPWKLSEELENKAKELYLSGMPSTKIAELLNLTKRRVLLALKRLGVTRRSQSEAQTGKTLKPPIEKEILYDLYINQKITMQKLAKNLMFQVEKSYVDGFLIIIFQ